MKLVQRNLDLHKTVYTLKNFELKIVSSAIGGSTEEIIDIYNIGFRRTAHSERMVIPFLLALVCYVWGSVLFFRRFTNGDLGQYADLFFFVLGSVFLYFFLATKRSMIVLEHEESGMKIEFQSNKPSKEKVEKFIKDLEEEKKKYFKTSYARINEDENLDQHLNNFNWLFNEGYINEKEKQDFIEKAINHFDNEELE